MKTLFTLILVIQVLSALAIIVLVLLQHGKGADMGAAFGSGASGSLFGATGSSNFLSKATAIAVTIFFASTLGLAMQNKSTDAGKGGVMQNLPAASKATDVKSVEGKPADAKAAQPTPATPADSGKSSQIPK